MRFRVVAALLFLPSLAPAQKRLTLSPAVGVTYSRYTGEFGTGTDPYRYQMGGSAGVTATWEGLRPLSVGADLLLNQKGGYGQHASFPDMRVTYLALAIWIRPTVSISQSLGAFLEGGIAPAVEVACSGSTIPDVTTSQAQRLERIPLDCDDMRTEKRDVSALAGAGLRTRVGRVQFSAWLRREWGLTNLVADYAPLWMRNRSWHFMLGAALSR